MRRAIGCVACLLIFSGCTLGPVWARRVEGVVVDADTGDPLPGTLVATSYQVALGGLGHSSFGVGKRIAVADAEGRFEISGHFAFTHMPIPLGSSNDFPIIVAFHPAYGGVPGPDLQPEYWKSVAEPDPSHTSLVIRMSRVESQLDQYLDAETEWYEVCTNAYVRDDEACQRMCELAYLGGRACE